MNMIFMIVIPVWYFVLGVVLILTPMLVGFYLLNRKQSQLLQIGQEQEQNLHTISEQTALIPNIDRQFMTPQYLAQFTITLKNKDKDVLQLGDIMYIKVHLKMLHFYTVGGEEYKMDGSLGKVVEGDKPLLPYPLFVRINKSEIINVLYVKNNRAEEIKFSRSDIIPKTLFTTAKFKPKALEAFSLRDVKVKGREIGT